MDACEIDYESLPQKLRDFYQSSERFRGYVDRCAANDGVTAEGVLELATVREVAKYYQELDVEDACRFPARKSTYAPMGECTSCAACITTTRRQRKRLKS